MLILTVLCTWGGEVPFESGGLVKIIKYQISCRQRVQNLHQTYKGGRGGGGGGEEVTKQTICES